MQVLLDRGGPVDVWMQDATEPLPIALLDRCEDIANRRYLIRQSVAPPRGALAGSRAYSCNAAPSNRLARRRQCRRSAVRHGRRDDLAGRPFGARMARAFSRDAGPAARGGSQQSVWEVVRDVLGGAYYLVRGTGIRVKDRRRDSRLVGGPPKLRKEGEYARSRLPSEERGRVLPGVTVAEEDEDEALAPMSDEWTTLLEHFREQVAGVEVPGEACLRTIDADWCLVVAIPRIEALEADAALSFDYIGTGVQ
jgi:hypothetical protein